VVGIEIGEIGKGMKNSVAKTSEEVRRILALACGDRELLILATPYLRFESNFLLLDEEAVHVRTTMGSEASIYGLRNVDLRIRFPHATRFLDAKTRLLGFGMAEGHRSIRLEIPSSLVDDDHRGAYRAERVGRVEVSFSTPRFDLRSGTLLNVSTTGARIQANQDSLEKDFKCGDPILITIPLTDDLKINSSAVVRWTDGRTMGLKFMPTLAEAVLTPLSRWIFQRREEDRERLERPLSPGNSLAVAKESRLVLVSSSAELEASLRDYLIDLPKLGRVPPTMAAMKEIALERPSLVLFHVIGLGLDDRKRLRAFVDALGNRQPFLLLGVGVEASALMELSSELKAVAAFVLGPRPGPFFHRLVQGILRRHTDGFEGTPVPRGKV